MCSSVSSNFFWTVRWSEEWSGARELLDHGSPTVSLTTRMAGTGGAIRAGCYSRNIPQINDPSSKRVGSGGMSH